MSEGWTPDNMPCLQQWTIYSSPPVWPLGPFSYLFHLLICEPVTRFTRNCVGVFYSFFPCPHSEYYSLVFKTNSLLNKFFTSNRFISSLSIYIYFFFISSLEQWISAFTSGLCIFLCITKAWFYCVRNPFFLSGLWIYKTEKYSSFSLLHICYFCTKSEGIYFWLFMNHCLGRQMAFRRKIKTRSQNKLVIFRMHQMSDSIELELGLQSCYAVLEPAEPCTSLFSFVTSFLFLNISL